MCGYALYNKTEWEGAATGYQDGSLDLFDAAAPEPLMFLPAAGTSHHTSGARGNVGTHGYYISSVVEANECYSLDFNVGGGTHLVRTNADFRAFGSSVRCIADHTSSLGCVLTSGDENLAVYVNNAITPIVFGTTGATTASVTGLPTGVSGVYDASGDVVISGTPTVTGIFNYTVTLTDGTNWEGCSGGTITVVDPGRWNGEECGAHIDPSTWKRFMCRNLGANPAADPFIPSADLNGDYYQWGQPTPAATRNAIIGTWGSTYNSLLFYGDDTNGEDVKVKSPTDPCPTGYRVPTQNEWRGVLNNNLRSDLGTWGYNNWSGCKFGNDLFLPTAGYRMDSDGALTGRGTNGYYWSNNKNTATSAYYMYFHDSYEATGSTSRAIGRTIRCIAE